MNGSPKIGIIGGAGWLGGAIAGSLLKAGAVSEDDLILSYRGRQPDRFPSALWTADNSELANRADVILLSVRPADWRILCVEAHKKLVISVVTGVLSTTSVNAMVHAASFVQSLTPPQRSRCPIHRGSQRPM